MSLADGARTVLDVLSLRACRTLVRRRWGRPLAAGIAVVYGISALLVGQMLAFYPTQQTSSAGWLPPHSLPWWDLPCLYIVWPSGTLILPFVPVLSMVLASLGVGLAMAVALVLAWELVVRRPAGSASATGKATLAGLTPVLLGLVTLGACCSSTAVSLAGIQLLADLGGTTVNNLLINGWYLNFLQLLVLGVALLAQEEIVRVYRVFRETPQPSAVVGPASANPPG